MKSGLSLYYLLWGICILLIFKRSSDVLIVSLKFCIPKNCHFNNFLVGIHWNRGCFSTACSIKNEIELVFFGFFALSFLSHSFLPFPNVIALCCCSGRSPEPGCESSSVPTYQFSSGAGSISAMALPWLWLLSSELTSYKFCKNYL